MTRFDEIKEFDIDDLAWFIQTIIEDTEQGMITKLAEYGLDVSIVTLDPAIRHAKILGDLNVEVDDGSNT